MLPSSETIRTYFAKLGLEPEIADIYLALHAHGPQSISELSRNSRVERTRIYRLIDKLMESNLIELESHYKRGIIKAAPIANLHILISRKEQELKALQDELSLVEQVLARNSLSSPSSRVQFYRGMEGIKQMLWNQTKASGSIDSMIFENMQLKTREAFFERWVAKCNERDIHFRGIISDAFLADQKEWYSKHSNERLKNWDQRYIAPEMFKLTHTMVIYDEVVACYNWKNGEIFGIEIYNAEITNTQRQFFQLLWEKAEPRDDPTRSIPTL